MASIFISYSFEVYFLLCGILLQSMNLIIKLKLLDYFLKSISVFFKHMKILFIPLLIDLLIKNQFEQTIICEANKLIKIRLNKKFKYKSLFHHCNAYSEMTALAKSGGWKIELIKSASIQLFSKPTHEIPIR